MSFHSLIQKVCLFLGSLVNTLISSVSEHPLTEQQWHFPSSHFPFYSNPLFAQETGCADSCRQLSPRVPWAGRREPCWGLFVPLLHPEVGTGILEGLKSSWCSGVLGFFLSSTALILSSSQLQRAQPGPALLVPVWKIPFGAANMCYTASSFFPTAPFEISLQE